MTKVDVFELLGVMTRLDGRASSVWVSHLATKAKIEQLAATPWHDPTLDRYSNKTRMKEVGAATMNFMAFISESLFMGLAKSLEDLWIDLKVDAGVKYDIWKSPLQPEYLHEAKIVRTLGNIIKHNQSVIDRAKSNHGKFLVDEAGFPNSMQLKTLFLSNEKLLKTEDMNYFMYVYCLDLLRLTTKFAHPVLALSEPERRAKIAEHLVPPVLNLNAI
jgi:hypothetical protein